MTLTSIGIAQYQAGAIDIIDTGSGDTVTFDDSGANVYSDNFEVTLSDPGAGGITFNGNSSFGTFSLSATTTDDIVLTSGASLKTSSGNITLSANQQATPTAGNFAGVTVNDATVQATGSGTVTVEGTGGKSTMPRSRRPAAARSRSWAPAAMTAAAINTASLSKPAARSAAAPRRAWA